MVILYLFIGIIGAAITCVLLWHDGVFTALACAPFGGSLLAAITALFFTLRSSKP
jgi:hypothetical protein